ncbi:MAG: anthranilate phosphoribosyltransferase [Bryobacteraceae bacterium]|nr:anthranilate phosphoribosyltransferase [Bryobacteraceae bacterium]
MSLLPYLHRVMNKESLSAGDARLAMSAILDGQASTAQIAAFATALRMKGETPDELLGLALAMRDSAVKVEHGVTGSPVLDTCGTGGDNQGTLNVSTIAAFVVAGAGVRVAKHGNRSMSSLCGSADLLEALGANIVMRPEDMGRAIREIGFGFLFAPALHPAMRHAQPARAELKTRTAFNLLGPLTNPAGATCQVVGAPSIQAAELMAVTLCGLGLRYGFVVHGADGLDEFSTTGDSHVFALAGGAIDHRILSPAEFGLPVAALSDLRSGGIDIAKAIALDVLKGKPGAYRDIVVANAALGLMAASVSSDPREAAQAAAHAIDSGAALAKLMSFIEFSKSVASPN